MSAQTEVSREYQIKAVFLFNFAQFVAWPAASFPKADSPFCIGVLGDDPFGDFLDQTVQGEKVDAHPLVVRRYRSPREIQGCQVLFISRSMKGRLGAVLAALKGRNILTVGDMDDFIQKGGVIRFVTEDDKIHFKIDLAAAKRAKLTISSQVLRLAEIVGSGEN